MRSCKRTTASRVRRWLETGNHPSVQAGISAVVALLALCCFNGCGTIGAPLPPTLALPIPVADLSANRTGNTVHLEWMMPRRTTDKLLIRQGLSVHICRRVESNPCVVVGDPPFEANKPAHFDDTLPSELTTGPPRPLSYTVEVRNHAGHAARASNPALTAAGLAPAAMTGLNAEVRADGVLLRWHPASGAGQEPEVRIHRTLIANPGGTPVKAAKSSLAEGLPPSPEQTLVVKSGGKDGRALDTAAAFDRAYTYRAERVVTVSESGHPIQIQGEPSETLTVSTRDIFPPRTPQGLAVVTVPTERVIDLSWTPDSEPDLVGYFVYRRDVADGGAPLRISPTTPIAAPAFRDPKVEAGRSYAYSVSAVDEDGNESPRSAEERETLPPAEQ